MRLSELIEALENIESEHGSHVEVRLATQPSYPLSHHVSAVRYLEGDDRPSHPQPTAVWLASSQGAPYDENPYAPRAAWEEE